MRRLFRRSVVLPRKGWPLVTTMLCRMMGTNLPTPLESPATDVNGKESPAITTTASNIKTASDTTSPSVHLNNRLLNQCQTLVKVPLKSVVYIVTQLKEGKTVPFLARYRKDTSGGLNELQINQIQKIFTELEEVERIRVGYLKSLKLRKLLTVTILEALAKCTTMAELQDVFEPYRLRRDRIADTAREKGLEPLANTILYSQLGTPSFEAELARDVTAISKGIENPAKLFESLIKEKLMQCPEAREVANMLVRTKGTWEVRLSKSQPKESIPPDQWEALQRHYANLQKSYRLNSIRFSTVLAIERGESKGVLNVKTAFSEEGNAAIANVLVRSFPGSGRLKRPSRRVDSESIVFTHFRNALKAAVKSIVSAAVLSSRRDLKRLAMAESIAYFAHNLRRLLLQRPLSVPLLAMDPGFRAGIKCVMLDENLMPRIKFVVNLNDPTKLRDSVRTVCQKYNIKKIVIGNGVGSRETELEVAAAIKEHSLDAEYAIVSETGASVYSASAIAAEEFPTLDILYRGAVSIGRRVQDPISELVKIPVKSLGVGNYQHDIREKLLVRELEAVTQSCVAFVGVNVETASKYLLKAVPGISAKLAEAIAFNRTKIRRRSDLLKVPGMTATAYESVAGSLRVLHSSEPLDRTVVHPEWYEAARKLLSICNVKFDGREGLAAAFEAKAKAKVMERLKAIPPAERAAMDKAALRQLAQAEATAFNEQVASQCGVGVEAVRLIVKALAQKSPDPRLSLRESGNFRHQAIDIADAKTGQTLIGVVSNVTPFGAFLDAGLGQDILFPTRHPRFPRGHINVGDVFENLRIVIRTEDLEGATPAFRATSSKGASSHEDDSTSNLRRRLTIDFEQVRQREMSEMDDLDTSTSLANVLKELQEERERVFPLRMPEGWLQDRTSGSQRKQNTDETIAM